MSSNIMISFISRVKNLSQTAAYVLVRSQKSEALSSRFYSVFETRISCENNYLISNALIFKQKSYSFNRKNYHNSNQFGKIVELDVDYNEIVADGDYQSNVKKKRNSKRSQNDLSVSTQTEEDIEDIKLEKKKKLLKALRTFKFMEKNQDLLSSLLSQLKYKRHRGRRQECVLEGKRLINDALLAGLNPEKIFFTKASDLDNLNLPEETKLYRIPYKCCKLWSDIVTPQGIIGIFKIPSLDKVKARSECIPLTVICDNVRDPGNMGAIIRVLSAVGCEKLILTQGCVDIWEQKVLRAGAGAHFHLPILKKMAWTDIENEISATSQVFLADCHDGLNTDVYSNFSSFKKTSEHLPKSSYHSVSFNMKNTVLILGGETHGLSDEATEFAVKRNGVRVFIPLSNNVESLNTAVAVGILAFEFKRQFSNLSEKNSDLLTVESTDSRVEIM